MRRTMFLAYGVIAYVAFVASFLYAVGFLGNFVVPKTIDSGPAGPVGTAIVVNLLLIGLFGVQHSVMARRGFKAWWITIVPKPIERSTFVLATSVVLGLLFWLWRPIPTVVWQVENPLLSTVITALFFAGWAIVLYASFLIDHFDLFGLRQVVLHWRGSRYQHPHFAVRSLYRWIRHPLMAGFILAIWSAPTMSQGHLLFAAVTTAYIFVGIALEERDLQHYLAEDYRQYRARTPMIVPLLKRGPAVTPGAEQAEQRGGVPTTPHSRPGQHVRS